MVGMLAVLFAVSQGKVALTHSDVGTRSPVYTTAHSQFYKVGSREVPAAPALADLIQYVLEKDELVFAVGKREFALRPLEDIRARAGRVLGRFERMSTSQNHLVLVFSGGDTRHECIVKVSAGVEDPSISECPYRTVLHLRLGNVLRPETESAVAVVSRRPTIGARLALLGHSGREPGDLRLPVVE